MALLFKKLSISYLCYDTTMNSDFKASSKKKYYPLFKNCCLLPNCNIVSNCHLFLYSLNFTQINFTNLERMINRSVRNQQRLHFSKLKNDYFTVIFQLLLIIVFLSSQYDEWHLMTKIFSFIAVSVAVTGSVIMKSGFYGFLIYGENRHFNEIELVKIKR